MPSLSAIVIKQILHLAAPRLNQMSIEQARRSQNKLGAIATWLAGRKITATPQPLEHCQAALIRAHAQQKGQQILLYLHGGAYTAGSISYAQGIGRRLASKLRLDVFCVAYRLAPEHPFPAALEDAFAAYRHLLALGYLPQQIILIGESAGGGLTYALSQLLQTKGMGQPGAIIALSPWTDLALHGASYQQNQGRDPALDLGQLQSSAALYAQEQLTNPLISPLYGQLAHTPRSLIICGADELLLDDARAMAQRLTQANCEVELLVEPFMWHAYVLYPTAEAKRAWQRIAAFLSKGPTER